MQAGASEVRRVNGVTARLLPPTVGGATAPLPHREGRRGEVSGATARHCNSPYPQRGIRRGKGNGGGDVEREGGKGGGTLFS